MPLDKILHIIAGLVIFTVAFIALNRESLGLALFVVYVMAIGKEVVDLYSDGNSEIMDIVATVAIPTLIYLTIKWP